MSSQEPLRDATFELLVAWQQNLPLVVGTAEGENDMLENWRELYARWERKVKSEEKAHAVMTVLEARGLEVTDKQRKKVAECSNLAQLEAWLRAAVTAPDVDAMFAATRGRRRVAT